MYNFLRTLSFWESDFLNKKKCMYYQKYEYICLSFQVESRDKPSHKIILSFVCFVSLQ